MADASDTMRYLVKSFDIAPAGTREEGQAAKSLSEVFHAHGLETANKSFRYSSLGRVPQAALAVLVGVAALLAGLGGALAVAMLILGIVFAAAYVLEVYFGVKTVSRLGLSGSSQNVVARHPAATSANGQKARPIVVIAHYDTPRADIFSLPALSFLQPYLRLGVTVCLGVDVACMLLGLLPLPVVLHSVVRALAVVASVALIAWGVCCVLQRFALPFTAGANDNKASVAALFGLLDRVRPLQGGQGFGPNDLFDELEGEEGALDGQPEPDDAADRVRVSERRPRREGSKPAADLDATGFISWDEPRTAEAEGSRASSRTRRPAAPEQPAAVRYGAEVVRSLGILPQSCEISYEDNEAPKQPVAAEPGSADETVVISSDAVAADAAAEAPEAAEPEPKTPEEEMDEAADAIMAGIVGTNTLSGSQAPDTRAEQAPAGATSLMEPVAAQAVAPQQAARPFHVITSSDEYDAELHSGSAAVPPDVADQSSKAAANFFADDPESPAAAVVSDPSWGTSMFRPVTSGRRILGDIPDPAVAAVDPFSVSSIDPMGSYNPEDFSELDFETGTHQSVTPNMLEDAHRRALEGFSDLTDDRRSRKAKKNARQGRISHQAARMQSEMQENSFNDWLGLDENYDAKTNGQEIGSWDNFNDDAPNAPQGGRSDGRNPNWQGGAARSRRTSTRSRRGEEDNGAREARRAAMTLGDRELIAHEIWFVLTGASEADHAGVADFLHTYRADLRGAYFINLECVGAGRQSLVLEEGLGRHVKADRRLVNLFGNASLAINRPMALARMGWRDTEATPVLRQGCRAVTVTGVEKGAPAHARWTGDTPEKVDCAMVDDLVDVLVEVIKNA